MLGLQNQRRQPRIPLSGIVISIHVEPAFGFRDMFRNYSKVKRSLVKESAIHVVLLLEQALW